MNNNNQVLKVALDEIHQIGGLSNFKGCVLIEWKFGINDYT